MTTQKPKVRYTYDDYCELPDDGNRYEVIDGALYMAPAPSENSFQSSGAFRSFCNW